MVFGSVAVGGEEAVGVDEERGLGADVAMGVEVVEVGFHSLLPQRSLVVFFSISSAYGF